MPPMQRSWFREAGATRRCRLLIAPPAQQDPGCDTLLVQAETYSQECLETQVQIPQYRRYELALEMLTAARRWMEDEEFVEVN